MAILADAIAAQALVQPELAIFTFLTAGGDSASLTFGELHGDAQRMAAALQSSGLCPGDTVIIAGEHDPDLLRAFVATLYAGATPTIAPYPSSFSQSALYDRRLSELAAASQARVVLTFSTGLSGLWHSLAADGCRVLDAGTLISASSAEVPATSALISGDSATPAYLQFSSGTTGTPKGAIISQTALLRHLEMLTAGLHLTSEDVLVGWAPFYHDLGLVFYLLLPLVHGIQTVTIAPDRWVRRPQLLLNALDAYGGTVCIMPNFGFAHTTRNIRDRDIGHLSLRRVRHLIAGAEVVQSATLAAFIARFERLGLQAEAMKVGYGMTECVFMASVSHSASRLRVDRIDREAMLTSRYALPDAGADGMAVVSCGRPLPEIEITVVDDTGNLLGERQIGEVVISSPTLFTSYVGHPELTANARRDGRLFTGDLGYLTDGELFIIDRKKDLIIAAGKHLYPEIIEQIALAVLGERGGRAAAFGLPSPDLGTEAPILVCEIRGQPDDSERYHLAEAIRRQVQRDANVNLADIRLVRRGWLEITTSGKVARSATRIKYLAAGYRPPTPQLTLEALDRTDPPHLEQALAALATQVLGVASLQPHDNLFDVGVDSLTAVRFILAVEDQTAVKVSADFFAQPTIARLAQLLDNQSRTGQAAGGRALSPHPSQRAPARPSRRHKGWIRQGPIVNGRSVLPYALGVRLQRAWLSLMTAHSRVFSDDITLVRRWGELAGVRVGDEVIACSLLANTWRDWRNRCLNAPLGASPWVEVTGECAWWQPPADHTGLIYLLLHSPLSAIFSRGLRASGQQPFEVGVGSGQTATPKQERAHEVYQAYQVLGNGGIVTIGGDGGKGNHGVVVPFFGGRRIFRQGGAEMAIQSGAPLIPVFCTISGTGRVEIEVCPPLKREGGSTQAQIEQMTRAYAELVVARWPRVYHCLSWGNLAQRLDKLENGQV